MNTMCIEQHADMMAYHSIPARKIIKQTALQRQLPGERITLYVQNLSGIQYMSIDQLHSKF